MAAMDGLPRKNDFTAENAESRTENANYFILFNMYKINIFGFPLRTLRGEIVHPILQ
jgi:hypothetical protein